MLIKNVAPEPAEFNSQTPEIEQRSFTASEIRASAEGQPPKVSGYAAVFEQFSDDLGGWFERIQTGAFTNSLKNDDVRALLNHDPNNLLGRKSSGTLRLSEDSTGLGFEIDPPDTQYARDMITSIRRGDLSQMSFAFRTIQDSWEIIGDKIIRTLMEVKLYDVSPVVFPAYSQTSTHVRSAFEAFKSVNPAAAEGQESHAAELQAELSARARLANLRKRLDLAEIS
jgi:uncharacterized protein